MNGAVDGHQDAVPQCNPIKRDERLVPSATRCLHQHREKIAYTNQLRGAFVAWRSYVADRQEETDTDDSDLPPPLVDSSDESNPDPDETQMYADEYESDSDSDSNSDPAFDRSMDRHRTMGHVVFHGGGWTPLTQVNDTTLHARALRAFLEHFRQEHGMPKQRSCSRQ